MTKPNYTHLSIIVDRSGSMAGLAKDASGGINSLVAEQAKVEGDITVSLYQFDTFYEKVYGPLNASLAPRYTLEARGGTALIDSVWRAIEDTSEFLRALKEEQRPSKVLFVVVTDGEENSSREIKLTALKNRITEQQETYKWEFMYIGSTLDAFSEGSSYGFGYSVQTANTRASYTNTYSFLNNAITNSRTTGVAMASAMPTNVDADGNATWGTVNQSTGTVNMDFQDADTQDEDDS